MPGRQPPAGIAGELLADAASALRRAPRHPWSGLAFVLILAVAAGTALASLDIASETLNGPLAYRDPEQIVVATRGGGMLVNGYNWAPNPSAGTVFSALAEYHLESDYLQQGTARRPWVVACVTSQFFRVLGVGMDLGVGLPELPPPAAGAQIPSMPLVLSHRAWVRYFNSDRDIVGRRVRLTRLYPFRFEIVGVAPRGVQFPAHVEAWIPEHPTSSSVIQTPGATNWRQMVIGRLRPGTRIPHAEQVIDSWPPAGALWPPKRAVALEPLRQILAGALYRLSTWLWPLAALFLTLALAAAVSVAHNDLSSRSTEFAIRQSLGASPRRIFRACCMGLFGQICIAGILACGICLALVRTTYDYFASGPVPTGHTLRDAALLVTFLGLALALAAGPLAFRLGILGPRLTRRVSATRVWYPPLLTAAASAILIMVVALTRSAYVLAHVPSGVRPGGAYVGEVAIPMSAGVFESAGISRNLPMSIRDRLRNARISDLYRSLSSDFSQIEARLRERSDVVEVGLITDAPYSGRATRTDLAFFTSSPGRGHRRFLPVHMVSVDAGAIPALGMNIVAGRNLSSSESDAVMVNRAAAALLGSTAAALREHFRQNYPGASWKHIVGVVANAHNDNLLTPVAPTIYLPFRAAATTDVDLVIRVRGSPPAATLGHWLRAAAQTVLPGAIVSQVRPLAAMVSDAAKPNSYAADFLLGLAVPGLLMVAICAWARAASEIRRREREIGTRLALGAEPGQIMRLLLRRDAILGILASGAGALFAWWATGLIGYLYRGGASGPLDYLAGATGVVALALATSCFVLRRALRRTICDLMNSAGPS